jgi:tetratricopeptide (TPR) repeat protein
MDLLAAQDKRALQAASVLGQRFDLATLRELLGDAHYDCNPLITNALVLPEGAGFLFAHALVQEGVYSSLLKARRRELHHRAADWFRESDPVLYAEHLAGRRSCRGARYGNAAEAQRQLFHSDRALALAERGLALATDPADRFELTCLRGTYLNDLGAIAESIAQFRIALQLEADDAGRCRAAVRLASSLRVLDELNEALVILDDAQQVATRIGSTAELARIHHLRGNIYFPMGRIDSCRKAPSGVAMPANQFAEPGRFVLVG